MSRNFYAVNGDTCIPFEAGDNKASGDDWKYVRNNSDGNVVGQNIILEDNFSVFPKKKVLYKVTVTEQSLTCSVPLIELLPYDSNGKGSNSNATRRSRPSYSSVPPQIEFKDVIGCHVMKGKDSDDKSAYFCIYHYPHKKKMLAKKSSRRRHTMTFLVNQANTYEENNVIAEHWKKIIVCLSKGLEIHNLSSWNLPQNKKYLIFVNPFSGTRKALTMYKETVAPILSEAEVCYDLVVTDYPNHARDMMTTLDLTVYKGIIIVSGDGLIFEVLNGLMMRNDWEEAVKIPIGAIPGGSGNALCCAINHAAGEPFLENWALHSAYILIKHQIVPMDLVAIDTAKRRIYSFLSISWGIMADVDIESEKYRRLGPVRFTIGGLTRIFNLRTYRGRLSFLPIDEYVPRRPQSRAKNRRPPGRSASMYEPELEDLGGNEQRRTMSSSETFSTFDDQQRKITHSDSILDDSIQAALDEQLMNLSVSLDDSKTQVEDINCNNSLKSNEFHDDSDMILESYAETVPTPLLPARDQEPPSNWVKIEDDFVMVLAAYQTHLGKDVFAAPGCKFDDGCIHLSFVRKGASRGVLFGLMSALETGAQLESPYYESVRVSAFRLEPLTPGGIIAVDGEVVDYGTIQAQILPSAARLMAIPGGN
ncbi:sphingosine kinase 2-like [Lineus longissimus]|uniref:sphingosine kinase 2-like n=1 Tax=Lineus longissimus TaxID=88925 RepID=UPI002B4E202C